MDFLFFFLDRGDVMKAKTFNDIILDMIKGLAC